MTSKKPPAPPATAPHGAARRSTVPQSAVAPPPRQPWIVALVGQKGGAGKTTLAISVSVEAMERGREVLFLDADPQGSGRAWADVAAALGTRIPTVAAMALGAQSHTQVPHMASAYDLTVIDCPPRHGDVQRAAMMVADLIVLPCGPSGLDLFALRESLELVKAAERARPGLRAVICITRKQPKTTLGREVRGQLEESGLPVLASELTFRVTYQEAPPAGMGPTTFAPRSPAAREVRALVDELEGMR